MLSVIIDWLEFTVLDAQLPSVLDTIGLELDEFSKMSTGRFGYQCQMKWRDGNIFMMFSPEKGNEDINIDTRVNTKAGIHIMISGQGCRQYSQNHDLIALIECLHALPHVNFTRIDLAIDDFESKIINYDRIHKAAIAGNFTSRWSKWDEINSRQTSDNHYLGRTMYFGSQASDLFCRVYDKTLERKSKKDAESAILRNWTRLEIVYRKDRAKKLADYIVSDDLPLGHALRGTLKQYLRFLLPRTDSNKARWKSAPWWDQLLENVDSLQLTIKKDARTIEDMTAWVDKQISPTLSAILKAQEGDLDWLRAIIARGAERLSQRQKDAIHQYQKQQKGLSFQ